MGDRNIKMEEEKYLYRFDWDCGRMGNVFGVFSANPDFLKRDCIDQKVYFG